MPVGRRSALRPSMHAPSKAQMCKTKRSGYDIYRAAFADYAALPRAVFRVLRIASSGTGAVF